VNCCATKWHRRRGPSRNDVDDQKSRQSKPSGPPNVRVSDRVFGLWFVFARGFYARPPVSVALPVGLDTASWITERLADYLGQHTGVQVTEETVRVYLHAHDYVCKRSTWRLRRKAAERADYVGNARPGRGAVSRCHSTRPSTRAGLGRG
jgi:Winged helix-turn helix